MSSWSFDVYRQFFRVDHTRWIKHCMNTLWRNKRNDSFGKRRERDLLQVKDIEDIYNIWELESKIKLQSTIFRGRIELFWRFRSEGILLWNSQTIEVTVHDSHHKESSSPGRMDDVLIDQSRNHQTRSVLHQYAIRIRVDKQPNMSEGIQFSKLLLDRSSATSFTRQSMSAFQRRDTTYFRDPGLAIKRAPSEWKFWSSRIPDKNDSTARVHKRDVYSIEEGACCCLFWISKQHP